MNFKLKQLVGLAAKTINANEKFAVPFLALKASRAAEQNPHDIPLVTVANVLTKMASNDKTFITRQELNKLYEQLYSPNTKLAEVFAEELDRPELDGPHVMHRDPYEAESITDDYSRTTDPVLANALSEVFEKNGEFKVYAADMAKRAEEACFAELDSLGLAPRKVSTFTGQSDLIICNAQYETPKGQSNVLVPVEIKEANALAPTMFLSAAGFMDLSSEALETHIVATAGKSYRVDGEELLKVLSSVKHGVGKVTSDVELALIRMRSEGAAPIGYSAENIVYQQVDAPVEDVHVPELKLNAEDQSIADKLATARGEAEFLFGPAIVDNARNIVQRKTATLGYKNAQVSVADCSEDTIFYAVALDSQHAFKVPVKISAGMIMPPNFVVASGDVREFTVEGVSELMNAPADTRMLAVASPLYGMRPQALLDNVKTALNDGNLLAAEEAINVLAQTDEHIYKTAVALFMEHLNQKPGMEKTAAATHSCTMIVKNSAHNQPICGHLNLPLNKVYQDVNGNCQPLYRKAMEDVGDGAWFMAHKVLL